LNKLRGLAFSRSQSAVSRDLSEPESWCAWSWGWWKDPVMLFSLTLLIIKII